MELCNITKAAAKAEVSRMELYRIRKEEPEFAAAWEEALQIGAEALEDAARERAMGTDRPVFFNGVEVGKTKDYSDTLMIFLLKGAKPDTYKDRVLQEQSGAVEITIRDLRTEKP